MGFYQNVDTYSLFLKKLFKYIKQVGAAGVGVYIVVFRSTHTTRRGGRVGVLLLDSGLVGMAIAYVRLAWQLLTCFACVLRRPLVRLCLGKVKGLKMRHKAKGAHCAPFVVHFTRYHFVRGLQQGRGLSSALVNLILPIVPLRGMNTER